MNKLTCLVASTWLVLTTVPWFVTSPVAAADVNQGRQHYQQHCAMCHGVNGDPEMAGAADFRRGEGLMQSDEALLQRIERGNRACPAFRGILREQEILDLISFVRTLF